MPALPKPGEPPIVPTREFVPETSSLAELARAARQCRGCPLYAKATQTVFGEGSRRARIVLVGEQPGDAEDRAGRPFVGPAGAMLNRALERAGIERGTVYVTNAVKHFNFESRGKARLHKKPRPGDVRACRPWLETELRIVRPEAIVLLGATAVLSLMGPNFRLTALRGQIVETEWAKVTVATWHPSMALRAPDGESRARILGEIAGDLAAVRVRIFGA
jgi:DNA polymerase